MHTVLDQNNSRTPAMQNSSLQRGVPEPAASPNAAVDTKSAKRAATDDVFDLRALLARFGGKRAFVVKLLTLFERDAAVHRDGILKAQAEASMPKMRAAAHALKGAALNVSARDISDQAAQLEILAAKDKPDSLDEIIIRLNQLIEKAIAAIPLAVDQVMNGQ